MLRELSILAVALLAGHLILAECPVGPKIVCYYSSWAYYRPDIGQFTTENINASLCTHIVYAFAGLDNNLKIVSIDPNVDFGSAEVIGAFANLTQIKAQNECVKIILAIGGWNEGSRKYSIMVSEEWSRKDFVEGVLRYLVAYGFDGIDVDWEYPTQRGGIAEDADNFVELLKLLHERLSKWNLEVSLAAPITKSVIEMGYKVPEINKYVSHVSIMAYDYTGTLSPHTGLNAPLSELEMSVDYWLANGIDKEKLILGLPTYARTFTLAYDKEHGIGAATNGIGRSGIYTGENGFLSYYELKKLLETGLYEQVEKDGNCYAYYKNDWFSYDNINTYSKKIDFALEKGLGGLMVWTLDTDDFGGVFGKEYELLNALNHKIQSHKNKNVN